MSFTKNHINRKAYNWLIYDCYERVLLQKKYTDRITGVLYDLGSGDSPYKDFFMRYAQHYIAVDWSLGKNDLKIDIIADLNQQLPIESAVADTVVTLSVLEHLNEPYVMLSEAYRILKSKGSIIIQVPWQWWIHEEPYDFFRYTPYGLKYLLEKAGFVNVVVEPQSGFFTMWLLKLNYFSLRLIRGPRVLRWLTKMIFLPIWYINQKMAPYLDRIDNNWAAETSGYFVMAQKE